MRLIASLCRVALLPTLFATTLLAPLDPATAKAKGQCMVESWFVATVVASLVCTRVLLRCARGGAVRVRVMVHVHVYAYVSVSVYVYVYVYTKTGAATTLGITLDSCTVSCRPLANAVCNDSARPPRSGNSERCVTVYVSVHGGW